MNIKGKMPKLTAVIIARNEETRMKKCLESLCWVEEIIVIDDCSSDNTVKIAKEAGAKVIVHKSDFNFDFQRNLGIENASGDWIIQLDVDEVIPVDLKQEILNAVNQPSHFAAYEFRRNNCFLGHFLVCDSQTYYIKLFRKDKGRYIGSNVHEILKVDGPVGRIRSCIEHYNFDSIHQFLERQNAYTDKEAHEILRTEGIISKKELVYKLRVKSVKLFFKYYFKKKGYKEGFHGLVFSLLMAVRNVMLYAKYWELVKDEVKDGA
jgi:glycosyltransferase involved in cell wall biosynthesis